MRVLGILFLCFLYVVPSFSEGRPLPRYASLRSSEVNVRTGPGTQFPILWVYRRSGYPVKIIADYDSWRQIEDEDGEQGWVYKGLLSSTRTVTVQGAEPARLFRKPDGVTVLNYLEPGVIAYLLQCNPILCKVKVDGRKGWVMKEKLSMVEELNNG